MNINEFVPFKINVKVPAFQPGDTVRVSFKVKEGDRERTQAFQGVVIRRRMGGAASTFTVRRIAHGVGVERTFLLHSPSIEGLEVVRTGKVRRAKLYHLRGLSGRRARIKERARTVTAGREEPLQQLSSEEEVAEGEAPAETKEQTPTS